MANRLAGAASPYLRQHAGNPVDWYPWDEAAFRRAREENKPVFLSIGYSTCHWCHVMERECFENAAVADLLNSHFVSIKVDRERHPDVDETYMIATQIITRHGGWPNSLFLTPDLKPFFAGTYFPPDTFIRLLRGVAAQWQKDAAPLIADGDRVAATIGHILNRRLSAQSLTPQLFDAAVREMLEGFDPVHGGYGRTPKFPHEPLLMFLLQRAAGHGDEAAQAALTKTLDAMLRGGLHDHLAGGFHRYSTDDLWQVPHFEKMLYNQAQLVRLLLGAFELTGEARYAKVAARTLDFVERYMSAAEGGFYSAWDADSEGEEGTYYVWTPAELTDVLGSQDGALAAGMFGVTARGNFEGRRTVLHLPLPVPQLAASLNLSDADFETAYERITGQLLTARETRQPPHLDDKVVLSWNGMMIAAFAEAARVLGRPDYAARARQALDFIETQMKTPDGGYLRSWYRGEAELAAQQEDYAWLGLACVLTYDATGDPAFLERAKVLADRMDELFADEETGDYYMGVGPQGFTRGKARSDGAVPSGNAVALELLVLLAARDGDGGYRNRAERLLAALSGLAAEQPLVVPYVLRGADLLISGEVGRLRYLAGGAVRLEVRPGKGHSEEGASETLIILTIAPGWHIQPLGVAAGGFEATRLDVEAPGAGTIAVMPPEVSHQGAADDRDHERYAGEVVFRVPMPTIPAGPVTATLSLQACSERFCRAPEKLRFFLV